MIGILTYFVLVRLGLSVKFRIDLLIFLILMFSDMIRGEGEEYASM